MLEKRWSYGYIAIFYCNCGAFLLCSTTLYISSEKEHKIQAEFAKSIAYFTRKNNTHVHQNAYSPTNFGNIGMWKECVYISSKQLRSWS